MESEGRGGRPDFEGGGERVPERPDDQPGPARGPAFLIVAVLGVLVLLMPVFWGAGLLARLGGLLGDVPLAMLWAIWALVVAVVAWVLWAMWRRAA